MAHEIRTITCLGSGSGQPGEPMYSAMQEVGRLLALRNIIVATGAYGGSGMEAPARGAREVDGHTVGYTLGGREGNTFLRATIDCRAHAQQSGLSGAHLDFGLRLTSLLSEDGFILGADGGVGTFLEFIAFILFATKLWPRDGVQKRLAILAPAGVEGSFNNDLTAQLVAWGFLDPQLVPLIEVVSTPEAAVSFVTWADQAE